MSHNLKKDQRRGWRGTDAGGQRRRMRPTVTALEDRRLLSTIVVNNPTGYARRGPDRPAAGDCRGEYEWGDRDDRL
jgi:hypothetical protein